MSEQIQVLKMHPDTLKAIDMARAYDGRLDCTEDPAKFEVTTDGNIGELAKMRASCRRCPLRLPCLFDGVESMYNASESDRIDITTARGGAAADELHDTLQAAQAAVAAHPRVPKDQRNIAVIHSAFVALHSQLYPPEPDIAARP